MCHDLLASHQLLRSVLSVLLFCTSLKLLKVLRYHQLFWRLHTVYRRCRRELSTAAVSTNLSPHYNHHLSSLFSLQLS